MSDAEEEDLLVDFPDPPSELEIDDRLAEQKARLTRARRKHESSKAQSLLDPETSRGMGLGLAAAYGIIGLPLVGAGCGWLVDRALGTTFVVAIGVVLGLVGGMFYAIQLSNRQ